MTIVILSIGMKQKDNDETAPDKAIVPVAKIHEPDTSIIDSDALPKIDEILNDPRLQGATTGISIRSASTGEIIYSNLGDTRVHPASVMKLLTGAAALETLGEDYTYSKQNCSWMVGLKTVYSWQSLFKR